jgi:flagellar biosynthesis/type III secretory pathway protein FliH
MARLHAPAIFSEIFDQPEPSVAASDLEPTIILPSYAQADVEAAQADGYADGYSEGLAHAVGEQAAEVARTVAKLAELLGDARQQATRVAEESACAIAGLLVAMIGVGYPRLRAHYGAEEVRGLAQRVLQKLVREPRVTVRVHPSMAATLQADFDAMPFRAFEHMTLEPTDAVPVGDVLVSWPDGAAIRESAVAWTSIAQVLEPLGLLPDMPVVDAVAGTG